ncbi:MAG: endolytic transglycosylase MltG [Deltaproteobacteria bacterium]|nr:endolytic transglycosylase MltG [Deltaproteobacteria bacterium]
MARRLLIGFMLAAAAVSAAIGWGYREFHLAVSHPPVTVVIEPGTTVAQMAEVLGRAGVIRRPWLFRALARWHGSERALKAGEYLFHDGLSAWAVYQMVRQGKVRLFRITLIEGWTMREMAAYLERQPFAWPGFAADFLAACRSSELLSLVGLGGKDNGPNATLEGYLFPDTYDIPRPKRVDEVARRLVQEFQRRFGTSMRERASALGLSMHQAVTLAAIIEKETGAAAERALVSSVFHNREDADGRADLSDPHPYNTYIHPGLPPGPIANPGLASLEAALNAAQTDYLYFVSKNDGTHAFAATYAEHARNVTQYQRHR